MTCKHCGAPIKDGAKFCENCGNKIEEIIEETVEKTVDTYKEPERVEADVVEEGPKAQTLEEEAPEQTFDNTVKADSEQGPIGYSIASLVCGILGLLCCCCGFFGLIVSAAGIVLGVVSLKKNCEGKGMAIAGIVCGGIGALSTLVGIIISIASGSFGLNSLDGLDSFDEISDFIESL